MKLTKSLLAGIACLAVISCGGTGNTVDKSAAPAAEVITVSDQALGWASYTGTKDLTGKAVTPPSAKGTNGGEGGKIFTVKNRSEFLRAAKYGGKKVIFVEAMIDLTDTGNGTMVPSEATGSTPALDKYIAENTKGTVIECADYKEWKTKYTGAFNYSDDQYGDVAKVRDLINEKWRDLIIIYINSNTTIIGAGEGCGITGGGLYIKDASNVVIRNLEIRDCYNPFPAIESDDGINADFDAMTIRKSKYVWIDHCTFDTRFLPEDIAKDHYLTKDGTEVKWQVYDGLCDIVETNDFVTVSWCVVRNHDKTSLIGNSDKKVEDKLHQTITLDHNWYENCVQRLPMVRFATLHVVNCVYTNQKRYGIDCRKDSRIYSENNSFEKEINSRTPNKKGAFFDTGSENINRKDLDEKPVWNPKDFYNYKAQSAKDAKTSVMAKAGAGKLAVERQ